MGPRTTWDLTIAIIVLQGLNVASLYTGWLGSTGAAWAAAILGTSSTVLTFMVTGIFRPAATK